MTQLQEAISDKITDGNDGCCYWQQKEPATQSPADTEGIE